MFDVNRRHGEKSPSPCRLRYRAVMPPHVLAVGEALIDIVHAADGSIAEHPGGSVANVAVALARLGQPARLATWLADDEHGRRLREWLIGVGVTLVAGSDAATRTPSALAQLDASGVARYEFDLAWQLARGAAVEPGTTTVHTGSIAAVIEPDVAPLLAAARQSATVSYDPNVRPALMPPRAETLAIVERLVGVADVVKVSDEDLAWLAPDVPSERVAERWLAAGPAIVVMTRGAAGAVAWCAAGRHAEPPAAVAVVDTVGAGDTFSAGLLWSLGEAGLLGADARPRLRAIDVAELARHVGVAARAAELSVQRAGADPPTLAELQEYVRAHDE